MSGIKALDKLRESSHLDDSKWTLETGEVVHVFGSEPNDPNAVNWGERWRKIADEIEYEVDNLIDDMGMTSVDGYEVPFNTPDALHMVLGAAADRFDTPEDAVRYLQGETSMLLPVDADGVPIRIGDNLCSDEYDGRQFPCRGMNLDLRGNGKFWTVCCDYDKHSGTSEYTAAHRCHHFKPRTIEDVLLDMLGSYHRKLTGAWATLTTDEELASGYADEIRELLGVGE